MAFRTSSVVVCGSAAWVLPVARVPTPAAGVVVLAFFFGLRSASCSANCFADATFSAAWSSAENFLPADFPMIKRKIDPFTCFLRPCLRSFVVVFVLRFSTFHHHPDFVRFGDHTTVFSFLPKNKP
jgi:hypothetical protein